MGQLSATYAPLVCHMCATCGPDNGHMCATRGPALQNACGPHVCLKWELFQLPHVGLMWPTRGMFKVDKTVILSYRSPFQFDV